MINCYRPEEATPLVKLKCPYQISVFTWRPGAILQWRHYTRAEEFPSICLASILTDYNFAVSVTTVLTDLPSLIANRRHSLFGHICRLSRDTHVSQAIHLSIDAFTGKPRAAHWKRPPGRPQRTWLQQVEEDMGLLTSACQFATLADRSLWRSLRPSAGQVQQ